MNMEVVLDMYFGVGSSLSVVATILRFLATKAQGIDPCRGEIVARYCTMNAFGA